MKGHLLGSTVSFHSSIIADAARERFRNNAI